MSNFIDTGTIALAVRAAARPIPHPGAKARFVKVATAALIADPRCAQPASPAALATSPDWARAAAQKGLAVSVFSADPMVMKALRASARALRDAWSELGDLRAMQTLTNEAAITLRFVEELFAKIDRMSLEIIAEKARWVAARRQVRLRALKNETALFEPSIIAAESGQYWRRVISIADLGRVGAAMNNCLSASSPSHGSYARQLARDSARFWVLETTDGACLAVAMYDVPSGKIREVRGPRNAPFPSEARAYQALTFALLEMYGEPMTSDLDALARLVLSHPRPYAMLRALHRHVAALAPP